MRICFVGPANSSHIVKWCSWFTAHGHEVHVISFSPGMIMGTKVHLIDLGVDVNGSDIGKLKYLTTGKQIKKLIEDIKPDIINAHYATSYGIAVALSGIRNYVLSVWGSDIYDFPKKSPLHKALLKYSLWKAPHLFSTSKAMAKEAAKYTKKEFEITPFGVDMKLFNPDKRTRMQNEPPFVIGTVKKLADLYGIEYILRAAAIIKNEQKDLDIRIRISGDGPDAKKYEKLANELGIDGITSFLGKITQEQAAIEWANLDVAVIPSVLYESFGVAAVEAQASEIPVVISDVDGLKESTIPGKSSVVVERKNEREIADAIMKLSQDPLLRRKMGENGRAFVSENFELQGSFRTIEERFKQFSSMNMWGGVSIEIRMKEPLIVGTIKGLSDKYGISDIIKAVAQIKHEIEIPIFLKIAGKGPQEEKYRNLTKELMIESITTWLGFISQEEAAKEWANMDIAIIPSTLESESFGVSAVEAQACGTPVIISAIPGLMEATNPGKTSIVVNIHDTKGIVSAINYLYSNPTIRKTMGNCGRNYVSDNYEVNNCFNKIQVLFLKYSTDKNV